MATRIVEPERLPRPSRTAFTRTVLLVHLTTVVPAFVLVAAIVQSNHIGSFGLDFAHSYWPATRGVLQGHFAYTASIGHAIAVNAEPFVYPPVAAFLLAPFGLFSAGVAVWVYTALELAAATAALYLCGVRDWRCFSVIFLGAPVLAALAAGNVSLLLAFGLAVLWRFRDRPLVAVVTGAVLISMKFFLWPILVWLAFIHRGRLGMWALATAAAANAALWPLLHPGPVSRYVDILRAVARLEGPNAYTIGALTGNGTLGKSLTAAAVAGLVIAAWHCRESTTAYGLLIVASLIGSPVVWLHYFAILIVPIAIARPRLSPLWFTPVLYWVCPGTHNGTPIQTAAAIAATAIVAYALWRTHRSSEATAATRGRYDPRRRPGRRPYPRPNAEASRS